MLACCKVYISESRNRGALESIEKAAKLFPESPIINKFEDEIYNRVGYTLVSKISPNSSSGSCSLTLKNASFAMVKAAFETIDLQEHCGTHPRLGVVDHICFHPLGTTSLDMVADTAKTLAFEVGSNLKGLFFIFLVISTHTPYKWCFSFFHNCVVWTSLCASRLISRVLTLYTYCSYKRVNLVVLHI